MSDATDATLGVFLKIHGGNIEVPLFFFFFIMSPSLFVVLLISSSHKIMMVFPSRVVGIGEWIMFDEAHILKILKPHVIIM